MEPAAAQTLWQRARSIWLPREVPADSERRVPASQKTLVDPKTKNKMPAQDRNSIMVSVIHEHLRARPFWQGCHWAGERAFVAP